MSQLAEGSVLSGTFRIVRRLTAGGMGTLYVAQQLSTGRMRALKVMNPAIAQHAAFRDRFVREAQIGSRIDSEHLVEVLAAGVDEALGVPWIAMELLEGEDVAQRVAREGAQPPNVVRAILDQLCHALRAAHAVGVVHRDLKPENVFLAQVRRGGAPWMVKLLDLGIATVAAEARLTMGGTEALGTPAWMAPEQTQGRNVSPAADVWALGLLAFYLLTGRSFWLAADAGVAPLLAELLVKPLPTASERARELGVAHLLPPGFDDWFGACVHRDPQMRFADARGASGALDSFLPAAGTFVARRAASQSGTVDMGQEIEAELARRDASRASLPAHGGIDVVARRGGGTGTHVMPDLPDDRASSPSGTQVASFSSGEHAARGTGTMRVPGDVPSAAAPVARPELAVTGAAIPVAPPPAPRAASRMPLLVGLGIVAVALIGFGVSRLVGSGSRADADAGATTPSDAPAANAWVPIEAKPSFLLGVDDEATPSFVRGLRPSRKVAAPRAAYQIQQHEVTWGELDPFLAAQPAHAFPVPDGVPSDKASRHRLPATNVPWATAQAYCKSIGGALPSEAQWELAARGEERRRFPWGDDPIDVQRAHVFQGASARPRGVLESDFDVTPGPKDRAIHGLAGNVQEWTADLYTPDVAGENDDWVQGQGASFRVVRGLPVLLPFDAALVSAATVAWREPLCASPVCSPGTAKDPQSFVVTRLSFVDAPLDGGAVGAAKPLFQQLVSAPETRTAMAKCFDVSGSASSVALSIAYARSKGTPICIWLDDGSSADAWECQNGTSGAAWYSKASTKVTVDVVAPKGLEVSACVKRAIEAVVAPPDPAPGEASKGPKWPDAVDAWTATLTAVSLQRAGVPDTLAMVGFRCARGR